MLRREVRSDEEIFGVEVSAVARMLWPHCTAEEIAALARCSVRNIEFALAGTQKWSGDALAVIVEEILKRNRIRNVRVTARR